MTSKKIKFNLSAKLKTKKTEMSKKPTRKLWSKNRTEINCFTIRSSYEDTKQIYSRVYNFY